MYAKQLIEIEGRLTKAWKNFHRVRQQSTAGWKDAQATRFCRDELDPLEAVLSRTTAAILELRDRVERAEAELADPDRSR